ncbi:FtsW/RodA/SpoVE family cell cycle protein [Candidatus Formimonas warabiya]|uniref:FtsW/RodA/SpoVE family cell cycle protein n=1 Tax=Formimonas warabiya TaxID=1761012 RepID=UPI0011D095CD|nr:FtsW/RodA/SpoVE family cell cycle protein [Candidatus Formimonas warabiya]
MSVLQNYRRPVNIIALINLIAFGLLYLYQKPLNNHIALVGGSMIGIIYLANILVIKLKYEDEILFLIVSMLSTIGMIILCRLNPDLGLKQILWFVLGNVIFFCTALIYRKINFLDQLIYIYPLISFILFCLTQLFGTSVKGATNWILIGNFSFQPSEIMKLLFVFFIAAYFRHPEKLSLKNIKLGGREISLDSKYLFSLFVYMQMGLLALQKELGTVLLFFLMYLVLFYVFDHDARFLLANGIIFCLGAIMGYFLFHHVQVRVEAWLNPWADVPGKGFQITQSLFAIGSGGFFGTGIGLGQPDYIPEVHTDFIFSAICEEMGIFGGIAVILLFFILFYRGIKITLQVKDSFHKAVALGVAVMFGFQAFIIIGGVIKLIPLTGITLPFISYGGSSLITSFIALGILQGISSHKSAGEEEVVHASEQENH